MCSSDLAQAHRVADLKELDTQLRAHKGTAGVHVYVIDVALHKWSEGGSFWEVGVPEVSDRPSVDKAHADVVAGKHNQRMLWNKNS